MSVPVAITDATPTPAARLIVFLVALSNPTLQASWPFAGQAVQRFSWRAALTLNLNIKEFVVKAHS